MLTRQGFELSCSKSEAKKLISQLTVIPNEGSEYGQGKKFCLAKVDASRKKLIVPYFFAVQNGLCDLNPAERFGDIQHTAFAFEGTLSPLQEDVLAKTLHQLRTKRGGILSLQTGGGKTVCAIAIAAAMKLRTLVIVHTTILVDQWKERIHQFAPKATVGVIQQNQIETECDVTIAMLQSLSMRSYPPDCFQSFGLLAVDEAHHIAAPVFAQAMSKVNCPYVLGLSATPQRKDGLTQVLNWFMGEVFYQTTRSACKHVTVKKIFYSHPKFDDDMPMNRRGSVCMTSVVSVLCLLKLRTAKIVSLVAELVEREHHCLVLSDRVDHCEAIRKGLEAIQISAGLFTGSVKPRDRKEALTKRVIVSTYALSREGLDVSSLNALVMATPKSDINQVSGRVLRGSASPVIIDIVDQWGVCYAQSRTRDKFYRECGFTVQAA